MCWHLNTSVKQAHKIELFSPPSNRNSTTEQCPYRKSTCILGNEKALGVRHSDQYTFSQLNILISGWLYQLKVLSLGTINRASCTPCGISRSDSRLRVLSLYPKHHSPFNSNRESKVQPPRFSKSVWTLLSILRCYHFTRYTALPVHPSGCPERARRPI